ncbi:MAG: hypothetical protein WDM89_05375 [Rhizomicrobium sp.]
MLKDRSYAVGCVLAILFLIGLFVLAKFDSSPAILGPNYETNYSSDYAPKHEPGNGIVAETSDDKIARYTWWLAALTAVLAGVSIYQGWMLRSADKTNRVIAESAKASADALPNVERAYLFLETISDGTSTSPFGGIKDITFNPRPRGFFHPDDAEDGEGRDDDMRGSQHALRFRNHGRTPAIITSLKTDIRYFFRAPTLTATETKLPKGPFIVSGGSSLTNFTLASQLHEKIGVNCTASAAYLPLERFLTLMFLTGRTPPGSVGNGARI